MPSSWVPKQIKKRHKTSGCYVGCKAYPINGPHCDKGWCHTNQGGWCGTCQHRRNK